MRRLSEHQFDLHFADGMLAGLKLIGLGIWERRSFALLRPIADVRAQEQLRDRLLEAFAACEDGVRS